MINIIALVICGATGLWHWHRGDGLGVTLGLFGVALNAPFAYVAIF